MGAFKKGDRVVDRSNSYFQHPRSEGEARGNIREIKQKQARLRGRGDYESAREWDAELRYQERLKADYEAETRRDIDRIWGEA